MFIMILYLNCAYGSILVKDTVYVSLRRGFLDRVDIVRVLIAEMVKGLSKQVESP